MLAYASEAPMTTSLPMRYPSTTSDAATQMRNSMPGPQSEAASCIAPTASGPTQVKGARRQNAVAISVTASPTAMCDLLIELPSGVTGL